MSITFACKSCNTSYTVNDVSAGKVIECKQCGQWIQVPSSSPVAANVKPTPPTATPAGFSATPAQRAVPRRSDEDTIRFVCPACKTVYTVDAKVAGKKAACKSCGQRIQVPTPQPERSKTVLGEFFTESASPAEPVLPLPVARFFEGNSPEIETQPEPEPYSTPFVQPRASQNGVVNRVVGVVGASLLLIGLFLPMFTGPFGFWVSFIDVPWKAVTVGFAIVDEVAKSASEDAKRKEDAPQTGRPRAAKPNTKNDQRDTAKGGIVVLVAIGSVVYPIVVLAVVGLVAIQAASGRRLKAYFFLGILAGGSTIAYAMAILCLNTVEELRLALLLVSPGFGWAVLLVGSFAVLLAGAIRR